MPAARDRAELVARRAEVKRRRARRRFAGAGLALVLTGALAAGAALTSGGGEDARDARPRSTLQASVTGAPAAAATAETADRVGALAGRTVHLDPGHNGGNAANADRVSRLVDAGTLRKPCDTVGAQTASGYTEAAYNLDVARRTARVLRRAGARVILTRSTNTGWGPCITRRAAIGNEARADAAVSIHADGGPASGRGFHIIYPPSIKGLTDDIAAESRRLALDVRDAYRRGTGMPHATYVGRRGLDVRSDLGGLNLSDVPKVFVETGNMRNPRDARLLESARFRERVARALAAGVTRYLTRD